VDAQPWEERNCVWAVLNLSPDFSIRRRPAPHRGRAPVLRPLGKKPISGDRLVSRIA
jgi:hypothetical protein